MLDHGQHVGEHLGRVPVVGQTVEDGHARMCGQLLDIRLPAAAELDPVEHPAEDPDGVLHRLLVAHLRAGGVEVGGRRALVRGRHLEGAAGPGRGLLEDQGDVPAAEAGDLGAGTLGGFQLGRQVDQSAELLGAEVQLLEEVAAREVYRHEWAPDSRHSGTRAWRGRRTGTARRTLEVYTTVRISIRTEISPTDGPSHRTPRRTPRGTPRGTERPPARRCPLTPHPARRRVSPDSSYSAARPALCPARSRGS